MIDDYDASMDTEIIYETYSVLHETLLAQLEDADSDFTIRDDNEDYLDLIVTKVKFIRTKYSDELDETQLAELADIEERAYNSIIQASKAKFKFEEDALEMVDSLGVSRAYLSSLLYFTFYLSRRSTLLDFLENYILGKRKDLAKQFAKGARKGLSFSAVEEAKKFLNPSYVPIIVNLEEIVLDIQSALEEGNISKDYELSCMPYSEEDYEVFSTLFGNTSPIGVILKGLVEESVSFSTILLILRNNLVERLSVLP